MADYGVVDQIVAELIARDNGYIAKLNEATRAHKEFTNSIPKTDAFGAISGTDAQKYVDRHRKAANDVAAAEEQATEKVVRTRKRRSDAAKSADAADAASAKASADKRVETEEQAQARISAAVDRGLADRAAKNRPARNSTLGRTNTYDGPAKPLFIPEASLGGKEEAAAEAEVNRLKVDQITSQAALNTLKGAERRETQDNIAAIMLETRLRAQGVAEEEVLLRLASLRGAQARRNALEAQAEAAKRSPVSGVGRFAEAATLGRTGGSGAAVAGIGVAAAVAGGVAAVDSSIAFAKQIEDVSQATGLTTKQVQIYQAAARQAGATNEQVASSFGHLNDQIGRAKEGDENAGKVFRALGIDIKSLSSAGDALPVLLQRLEQIHDPAERAAVGQRLFGEEYRRLDAVLGQGSGKIDALAASLEKAGTVLSDGDIATLKQADVVLGELKNKLEVDLARVVAGNRDAILSLADAFGKLAEKALGAFSAIRRQGALEGLSTEPGIRPSRPDDLQVATATPEGRAALRAQVDRERAQLNGNNSLISNVLHGTIVTPAERRRRNKELDRQDAYLSQDFVDPAITAQVQGFASRPTGKIGNIGGLFAPRGQRGPRDKSPDQLAADQAERDRAYLDRLASLQETSLRAQEASTGSITEQAKIEKQLADRALAKLVGDGTKQNPGEIELTRQRNVDRISAEHAPAAQKATAIALENAHAAELTAAAKAADAAQRKVSAQETQVKLIDAATQHLQTQLAIDGEILSTQASLADTRKERLAIELKLLANQKAQERNDLNRTIRTALPGSEAAKDAQTRLNSLDTIYAGRAQQTQEGSLSPLAAYRKQLTSAVGDTKDALEGVEVNALTKIDDQLSSTIGKVLGLKGAFGELAASIIQDLAKIEIEKAILGVTGGGSGGGGIGGLFGSITGLFGGGTAAASASVAAGADAGLGSALSGISALTGFANGGTATIGGNPGVDQNVLSINGVPSLRVGRGEQLSVNPVGPVNQKVAAPSSSTSIVQHFHIDASNSVNPDGFEDRILTKANGYAARAAATAGQRAAEASPAVVSRVQRLGS